MKDMLKMMKEAQEGPSLEHLRDMIIAGQRGRAKLQVLRDEALAVSDGSDGPEAAEESLWRFLINKVDNMVANIQSDIDERDERVIN